MSKFSKNEDGSVTYNQVRVFKDRGSFVITANNGEKAFAFTTRDAAFRNIDRMTANYELAQAYLEANPTEPVKSDLANQWVEAQAAFSKAGQKMNTSYGAWSNITSNVSSTWRSSNVTLDSALTEAKDHIAMVMEATEAVEVARQTLVALAELNAEAELNAYTTAYYSYAEAVRTTETKLDLVK